MKFQKWTYKLWSIEAQITDSFELMISMLFCACYTTIQRRKCEHIINRTAAAAATIATKLDFISKSSILCQSDAQIRLNNVNRYTLTNNSNNHMKWNKTKTATEK